MLLRDELEELRMVAQKVQAKIDKDNVHGRVLIKPEILIELILAYEQVLEQEKRLPRAAPTFESLRLPARAEPEHHDSLDVDFVRPFKW